MRRWGQGTFVRAQVGVIAAAMLALQAGCGPAGDGATEGWELPAGMRTAVIGSPAEGTEDVSPPGSSPGVVEPSLVSECEGSVEDVVFPVYQDTYVHEQSPDTSFSTAERLAADGSPRQRVFLNFQPDPDGRPVLKARLRLWARDGASGGFHIHPVNYWKHDFTITWNSPLPAGGAIIGPVAVVDEAWNEFDVTRQVSPHPQDDGVSFALISTSGDGAVFTSKEGDGGTRPPQLVLTLGPKCNYHGNGTAGWLAGSAMVSFDREESLGTVVADRGGGWVTVMRDESGGFHLRRFGPDGGVTMFRNFAQGNASFRLAVTPLGNFVMAADYSELTLEGRLLPSALPGSRNLVLVKLKPNGTLDWFMTHAPNNGTVSVSAVETDANGSLVVLGNFRGSLSVGGAPLDSGATLSSQSSGFVARIRWDAQHLWSHAFPTGQEDTQARALAVREDGNVLVGGGLGQGATLNGQTAGGAVRTPFLAQYRPDGSLAWTKVLQGASGVINAVAASDGWAFAVNIEGGFDFAGTRLQATSAGDPSSWRSGLVLGSVTPEGGEHWAKLFGSSWARGTPVGLKARADGTLILAGRTGHPIDLGGGYVGQYETPFLAGYNGQGAHLWSRTFLDPRVGWDEPHPLNHPHFLMLSTGEPVLGGLIVDPLTVDGQSFNYDYGPFPLVMLRFNPE